MTRKPAVPRKTKSRYPIIAAIALLIFTACWFRTRSDVPANITVKFAGFTNDTAAFVISNQGNHRFFQTSQCTYKFRGDDRLGFGGEPITSGMLSPGQSTTILVHTPPDDEYPWRIDLCFLVDDWRLWLAMKPPWVKDMVWHLIPVSEKKFMEKRLYVASEWLSHEGVTTPRGSIQQFPNIITTPPQTHENTTNTFGKLELKL